jgi:hypothetical protein
MEKIISGQAFLYRTEGLPNTVIDVHLHDKVRGDLLRLSLSVALQRYPYLAGKFVEKNGVFYWQENYNGFTIAKTDSFRSLGSMRTGYHLIDITYIGSSIRISFHHALCDGKGIKPFVETLIYYYCCQRYDKNLKGNGIRLADDPLFPGETDDPYAVEEYKVEAFDAPKVISDGYALPQVVGEASSYRCDINISKDKMLSYAKAHGATPAILLALLMSKAIKTVHPDTDKPIVCSMACDYRYALGCENTHRNCVGSVYLPFTNELAELPVEAQAAKYREYVSQQKEVNFVRTIVNRQMQMFKKVEDIKTLEERKKRLSFIGDLCINTFVISYLGQMQFGDSGKYVQSVGLYSSGYKGLRVNMIASDQIITVNMLSSFPEEAIVAAFVSELDEIGAEYNDIGCVSYNTEREKAHITAGRQPEKYYKRLE